MTAHADDFEDMRHDFFMASFRAAEDRAARQAELAAARIKDLQRCRAINAELLAALGDVRKLIRFPIQGGIVSALNIIDAAIAKAKGGA